MTTGKSRQIWKYNLKDVEKINAYNPLKNVVQSQFEKYGRNYKGQVSILRLDDEMVYPLSFIDTVIEDADTESQIKLFKKTFAQFRIFE